MVNKSLQGDTKPIHQPLGTPAVRGAAAAFAVSTTVMATTAMADPLAAYAWSHRPLVVAAPTADDPGLVLQRTLIGSTSDQLADRDMVVIEIVDGMATVVVGETRSFDGEALLRRLELPTDGFSVVLVGKDTGVKLRSAEPVSAVDLFALIDQMPMRRRETNER